MTAIIVLLYFLCGLVYALLYTLVFKPKSDMVLWLAVLGWWVYIVVESALALAKSAGALVRFLAAWVSKRISHA